MNKIQNTKANSTIRRVFSRMGGGLVKALGYKAVNIDNEGGGTSSEDAERMYEAFYGQVPYFLALNPDDNTTQVLPLYELFTALDEGLRVLENLYYKSDTPIAKACRVHEVPSISIEFAWGNVFMVEAPEEEGLPEDNTWYYSISADINLIGYNVPTENNPTVVSGILPTDISYLAVVESNDGSVMDYEYNDEIQGYSRYVGRGMYTLKQIDASTIEWSYSIEDA